MTQDHNSAITTYIIWRGKNLWNGSVHQTALLFSYLLVTIAGLSQLTETAASLLDNCIPVMLWHWYISIQLSFIYKGWELEQCLNVSHGRALHLISNSSPYIEHDCRLHCAQNCVTGTHLESFESDSHPNILSQDSFQFTLVSTNLLRGLFCYIFKLILYAFIIYQVLATYLILNDFISLYTTTLSQVKCTNYEVPHHAAFSILQLLSGLR